MTARIFALLLLASGCTAPIEAATDPVAQPARADVDTATLKAELDSGRVPLVLDVRSSEEFASGHVPGARNISVDQLERRLGELDPFKGGKVYVICEVGGRSSRATDTLLKKGIEAINVKGGTKAWREAGYPTE